MACVSGTAIAAAAAELAFGGEGGIHPEGIASVDSQEASPAAARAVSTRSVHDTEPMT